MKLLMMTNTYLPHVGGVARSVEAFSRQYIDKGHEVMVVAPEFEGANDDNADHDGPDVVRIPAIQHFNGSDFSVVLPVSGLLGKTIKQFDPDIIHSHHPFLIGSTALRVAALHRLPHVFTHHTMYEQYTHYVPGDSTRMQNFAIQLATHYANLCDQIIAPSESIAEVLRQREVTKPIDVVATGVQLERFSGGDVEQFRKDKKIPQDAFVVGHLGRLAGEKNLPYLAKAISLFLLANKSAYCLMVGKGPATEEVMQIFEQAGVINRVVLLGILRGDELACAYRAMDVFAFASKSETQGMVLTEAMAANVPVIALDAPGVREVVKDGENGRLLFDQPVEIFADVLTAFASLDKHELQRYRAAAYVTAEEFSLQNCADQALAIYQRLIESDVKHRVGHEDLWSGILPLIKVEWQLAKGYTESAGIAVFGTGKSDNDSSSSKG